MSIENVKKLELGINKAAFGEGDSESLTDEELQILVDEGMDLVEQAISSKEMDVLERAFDYFLEESDDNGLGNGVCETLINDIFNNFTMEQIIEVLYKKFGALVEKNMLRAVLFAGYSLNLGYFNEFRDIFNHTHSPRSTEFLEEFSEWYAKDYPKEIAILREDMETWPEK